MKDTPELCNIVTEIGTRIDDAMKKNSEDLTHIMFCHSGSQRDLPCDRINCDFEVKR